MAPRWSFITLLAVCLLPLVAGFPNEHIGRATGGGADEGLPPMSSLLSGQDMQLTPEQYQELHVEGGKSRSTQKVLAIPWTNGVIPYTIHPNDFEQRQIKWIEKAMRDWERYTCVRFRPATASDKDHSVLIKRGSGCWAHLGMIQQNPQIVNLEGGSVGCFWKGMIHHELGHTIGLIHEHQRETRDAYIRVDYYTVAPNMIDAVEKYARGADTKLGLPYDYDSVMHYSKTAFSLGFHRTTIHTRDPTKEDVIGMTLLPSFTDYKLVNMMYQCAGHCSKTCGPNCFVNKDCGCTCKDDLPKEDCKDLSTDCARRAKQGDCINRYGMMHHRCRKTCGICTEDGSTPHLLCVDALSDCQQRKQRGECESNFQKMQYDCRLTCGVCKTPDMKPQPGPCTDRNGTAACKARADKLDCQRDVAAMLSDCTKSCDFCPEDVGKDPAEKPGCVDYDQGACTYRADSNLCKKYYTLMALRCPVACGHCNDFTLPSDCADSKSACPAWAFRDECINNPSAMLRGCKLSCDSCDGINKPDPGCLDYNMNCEEYARKHQCFTNPSFMLKNCAKSCKTCPGDPPFGIPCENFDSRCKQWASEGECDSNPGFMLPNCKPACGECEEGTIDYNNGTCQDERWTCFYWYTIGECERNPDVMLESCRKSCKVCSNGGFVGTRPTPATTTTTTTAPPPPNCHNNAQDCEELARDGQCFRNAGHMLRNCKRSCNNCKAECMDESPWCEAWANGDQCDLNPSAMLKRCQKSCKVC